MEKTLANSFFQGMKSLRLPTLQSKVIKANYYTDTDRERIYKDYHRSTRGIMNESRKFERKYINQ